MHLVHRFLILILAVSFPLYVSAAAQSHYTIIIDAGSSGSRVHLYQYDAGNNFHSIKEVFTESNKQGLSSFADHPEEAGASLKILLDDVQQQLSALHVAPDDVKLDILATAGMRLLPEKKQQQIYTSIENYLAANYPATPIDAVETISGKFESLYGWLDINALSGGLDTGDTLGSIDMGGASTEISFITEDHSHSGDETTVIIGSKRFTVFSQSFLGAGEDQALASINADSNANTCYPIDYPLSQSKGNFTLATCGGLYHSFITDKSIARQVIPSGNQKFIAFSGTYYTYKFFGIDTTPDQSSVEKRLQTICTESWEQLQHDYPGEAVKYLSAYCANGVYLDELLYGTYQLSGSQLQVSNKINNQDIDWARGALIFRLLQDAA
jgi:Golgi nucleoside diphosphatase